jgi:hypothetical protein
LIGVTGGGGIKGGGGAFWSLLKVAEVPAPLEENPGLDPKNLKHLSSEKCVGQ